MRVGGHTVTYLGSGEKRYPAANPKAATLIARVQIDGGKVHTPAITQYRFQAQGVGTPSVRTGLLDDVYTTLVDAPGTPGEPATIGVLVHPLTVWLWFGAALMGIGTMLAAMPGSRRRPTEPASAPPRTGAIRPAARAAAASSADDDDRPGVPVTTG
jgi:cytochrome c-type biogenesis protein CcmF